MLDDPIEVKRPALINYLQYGIDLYGMLGIGTWYGANGGHLLGRVVPATFAAVLINDPSIEQRLLEYGPNHFSESESVVRGREDRPLWGQPGTAHVSTEYSYWENQVIDRGSRTV